MAVQRTLIGNIKGPKGDKGDTGSTGARGAGATVSIGSVTTIAYGGNANVTNGGTPTDAVFNFVLPQGAPGETVTDIQDLTLSSISQPSSEFPTPSIGDDGKTLFGKVAKWESDMSDLVNTKFNTANVVNNLTTTNEGYALDARQGKVLYDKVCEVGASLYQYHSTGITIGTTEQVVLESAILEPGVYLASSGLMASYPNDDSKILSTGLRVYRESENYQTPIDIGVDGCCSKSSHLTIAFYSLTRFKIQLVATALGENVRILGDGRFNYLHVSLLRRF